MNIFISHSSRDAEYVQRLMNFLRVGLRLSAGSIRATSLEQTQLAGGADVNEALRQEILDSEALIAVVSPTSLHSMYVMFELGARWGSKKKIFPLLLDTVDIKQISGPLKAFHILKSDRVGLWNLVKNIGETLNIEPEKPDTVEDEIENVLKCPTTTFAPMALAVLSYVLDNKQNFALLKDTHYKKIQPPGRRLEANEYPHDVALRSASEELDLPIEELIRFPKFTSVMYKTTRVVPPPYQVQVETNETNPHRTALAHYDFVYVFYIDRAKPPIRVAGSKEHKSDPEWYSLAEVKKREAAKEYGPHEDMLPTMRKIISELQETRRISAAKGRRRGS